MEFWQLTQNLGKGLRTNLGGSPRRLRHLCQFYFLDHLVSSSPFAYTYRKNLLLVYYIINRPKFNRKSLFY